MNAKSGRGLAGLVAFFLLWEFLSRVCVGNLTLFPPPTLIFMSATSAVVSGELFWHALASGRRAILGFLAGAIPAVILGILTATCDKFADWIERLLNMLRSIPALALVPFGIFWFGIGDTGKVLLVAWTVFFPVWVNADAGIREVSPVIVRAAASLGATGWRMLVFVHLPAALPYIITGMRVSLSAAVATLVAAELAGAVYGLGYLVALSQQVFRVDLMFVALIALGIWSVLLNNAYELLVQIALPWYGAERQQARQIAD